MNNKHLWWDVIKVHIDLIILQVVVYYHNNSAANCYQNLRYYKLTVFKRESTFYNWFYFHYIRCFLQYIYKENGIHYFSIDFQQILGETPVEDYIEGDNDCYFSCDTIDVSGIAPSALANSGMSKSWNF